MRYDQARNVVTQLQVEPLNYRSFGVWWWWVKAELKRWKFDHDNLAHLGAFTDKSATQYYTGLSAADLDARAFEAQADGQFTSAQNNWNFTPDGDPYFLLDSDVE